MDNSYLSELSAKLMWCEEHYRGKHRFAAFKMVLWSTVYLVFGKDPRVRSKKNASIVSKDSLISISQNTTSDSKETAPDVIRIALITSGGMGDHVLFANWVYHFWNTFKSDNILIDVVFKDKFGLAGSIFTEGDMVHELLDFSSYEKAASVYDLALNLAGFPQIEKLQYDNVRRYSPRLLQYVEKCDEYRKYCRGAFRGNAYAMAKLCELEGRRLIQRGDIYSLLGITEEYKYPLPVAEDAEKYLSKVGLVTKQFITVQTGIDVVYASHIKQWPIAYYKKLIKMIQDKYPELMIVQVGNSGEVCAADSKNFMDLVKKTSLDEAKVLMQHSLLHIDIEGGMVHLRHALNGGRSIVMFGPTSPQFFGYSENINLRSEACGTDCYQLTSDWPVSCPKGTVPVCMMQLMPERVFEAFAQEIENLRRDAMNDR